MLLVIAAALVQIGGPLVTSQHQAGYETPPPGGVALLALGVAAIPLRLTHPVAALLAAFGGTLHVVAHNMSLINLQAGVALHRDDGIPDPTREALQTVKAASKEALVELHSILGVLRHADDGDLYRSGATGVG